MGWALGEHNGRDVGYGVPAYCDHPSCSTKIDRGLGYVCGGEPYGGDKGCGLFFCPEHMGLTLCERCAIGEEPFPIGPDHPEWIGWKLANGSWEDWRKENPSVVDQMRAQLAGIPKSALSTTDTEWYELGSHRFKLASVNGVSKLELRSYGTLAYERHWAFDVHLDSGQTIEATFSRPEHEWQLRGRLAEKVTQTAKQSRALLLEALDLPTDHD